MRHIIAVVWGFILVAGLAASSASASQEASPTSMPSALPPVVAEWLEAFNAGDTDRLLAVHTEDALWEEVAIGLVARGPDQIRAHLDNLFRATPDITYDVTNTVVTDDQVMVEWVVTGTYQQDFPGLPPAAGQPFSFRGASVFELEDGKVRRYTEYWDAYSFLVQLGALPAPGAAPPGTPTPGGRFGDTTRSLATPPA